MGGLDLTVSRKPKVLASLQEEAAGDPSEGLQAGPGGRGLDRPLNWPGRRLQRQRAVTRGEGGK